MSAIDTVFAELRQQNRKAFVPFVTAGDPSLDFTKAVIAELVRCGSSICEIGVPYSDPIADGPVIQASYTRALDAGIRLDQILSMVGDVAPTSRAPLVTMLSYAIVLRRGLEKYVNDASAAGVAGAIIPDLPVEEADQMAAICQRADFSLIQLVTPTTDRDRALRIAETSTGFLYYVSVTGITGERSELPANLRDEVAWLREQTDLPICIGFGISQPEHVRLLSPVADGVIVGSGIMRRIADGDPAAPSQTIDGIGKYVQSLIEALESP
jgi:tryptophan synthase alpha chain